MRIVDLIRKKRDGGELTREEIKFLVDGCTSGAVPDYQISAWLMATLLRGMSRAEIASLTEAMLHSGEVLDLSALPGKKVDKHSTGGVGDKTSLVIAPAVAAAGVVVPMISGRGLGHTGGTLDKLEAIPGFNVRVSLTEFRRLLREVGCGLIGQTEEIAPADREFYALRDVTGTIPSIPLITSSILSKKLAEGIDGLVLDVKTGSGAFMKRLEDSRELAGLMVEIGKRVQKKVVALITDMDQPLGNAAGNSLEVIESVETLKGGGPRDLRELCLELAGWMLVLGGKSSNLAEGRKKAAQEIASGRALETFRKIVELQGGDPQVLDDYRRLPTGKKQCVIAAEADGIVESIECELLGIACCRLGAGRERVEDRIDPAVGLIVHRKVGDRVSRGEPLVTLHYNDDAKMEAARAMVTAAYRMGGRSPARRPLVFETLE